MIKVRKNPGGQYKGNFKDNFEQHCLIKDNGEELLFGIERDFNGEKIFSAMSLNKESVCHLMVLMLNFVKKGSISGQEKV